MPRTDHQHKQPFVGSAISSTNARRQAAAGAQRGGGTRLVLRRGRVAELHAVGRLPADRRPRARGRHDARGPRRARRAPDRRRPRAGGALRRDPRPARGRRGRARGDRGAPRRAPAPRLVPDGRRDAHAARDRPLQRRPSGRRALARRGRARGEPAAPEGGRARRRADLRVRQPAGQHLRLGRRGDRVPPPDRRPDVRGAARATTRWPNAGACASPTSPARPGSRATSRRSAATCT